MRPSGNFFRRILYIYLVSFVEIYILYVNILQGKGSFTKCGACVLLKNLTTASTNPEGRKSILSSNSKLGNINNTYDVTF